MDDAVQDAIEVDEPTMHVEPDSRPPMEEDGERDDLNTPLVTGGGRTMATQLREKERETLPLGFDEGLLKSLGELDVSSGLERSSTTTTKLTR